MQHYTTFKTAAITVLITFTLTAIVFSSIVYIIMQPKPDKETINIKVGLTPIDIYPIQLDGWQIKVQLDGYLNISRTPQLKCDFYIAENGKTQLQSTTLLDIIRQIMQHDNTISTTAMKETSP